MKNKKTIIGFIIASIFFLIVSLIDGSFNKQFFSMFILLLTLALVYLYKDTALVDENK